MKSRSTWPVWAGFVLTLVAFISYLTFFVYYASTRDFPWVTFLLFAVALVLVAIGLRRSFGDGARRWKKIANSIGAGLSVVIVGLFVFGYFVGGRQIPASKGSPQVGQKAPEFQLPDSNGKTVALSELLTTPVNGKSPRGVLVVFYRGYW